MTYFKQSITIINIRKPMKSINEELQWFGTSLGLFNLRDKDKSQFRLFLELLKAARERKPLNSDELAGRLKLTRGTVIHHMHKLMESGIVLHEGNAYILRVSDLKGLVDEIEKDIQRTCDTLRDIADDIDKWMVHE